MISSEQLADILAIAFHGGTVRVLLCGDGDQLGPIDAGCPFFDLMQGCMIPMTRLAKIYRQDPRSHGIRELCLDVLAGEIKISHMYAGVDWHPCNNESLVVATIVDQYVKEATKFGAEQVLVIAPFKDQYAGVNAINAVIRQHFGFNKMPVKGEVLLAHKNNYDIGILNGMRLIVEDVRLSSGTMIVRQIGRKRDIILPLDPHAHGPCKTIAWGYSATTHKFQGSEADSIIVGVAPDVVKIIRGEPWHFDKSAIYTAFSRAKKHLTVVGDFDQSTQVIKFERRQRVTALLSLMSVKFGLSGVKGV